MSTLENSLTNSDAPRRTTLLITLTTGHLVNDFYLLVLPFLIPTFITTFNLTYLQAGLLALATTILSGLLQPVFGYLADKYAIRKRVMLFGFAAFSSGVALMGLSASYLAVLLACFIYGLGQATFHPQSTNFLTRTYTRTKGRIMGIHGLGGSIGNFLAPTVVAFLISLFGWRSSTFMLVVPALLVIILLSFVLREPPKTNIDNFSQGITGGLIILAVTYALNYMMYQGFLTFLPTFLVEGGATIAQAGGISSLMLLVGMLAQPSGGYLYDKMGGKFVFVVCSIGSGTALLLFTFSQGVMAIIFIILVGAFITALFPVALTMASEISKGGRVGMSVGIVFGLSGTLSSSTPALTGYAADLFGLSLAFRLLVVLSVCAVILAMFLPSRRR